MVFTTNALELGLDIGGLDGVILAGFPPSIMSAWQQIGRAGRGLGQGRPLCCFYSMNDPIDRFFVGNLDAFLDKPFDELVIDPSNEELIDNHLAPLAAETAGEVYPSEEGILGSAFYQAARKDAGKVPPNYRPHHRLNMRGGIGRSFELKRGNEEVGQHFGIAAFSRGLHWRHFHFLWPPIPCSFPRRRRRCPGRGRAKPEDGRRVLHGHNAKGHFPAAMATAISGSIMARWT